MHGLILFILAMAEYRVIIAGANGVCHPLPQIEHAMPLTSNVSVNNQIRMNCMDGYVRQAGTSNLFSCIEDRGRATWAHQQLPLKCIPDPKRPRTTTDPPRTKQRLRTSTTEKAQTSSILATATAFGEINEVSTTEARTTLKKITKENSITKTNEVLSSISSKSSLSSSRQYVTTRSSLNHSDQFTTTTGVNISKTTTSENFIGKGRHKEESFAHRNKSTIGGAAGVIFLCLAAAVFLLWWRSRHRATNATNEIKLHDKKAPCTHYTPVAISDSEHCSAEPNTADASGASTSDSQMNR